MTSQHQPTPDEVLAILVDQHRHQPNMDSEAEPGAVLTFDSSIADWRSACDLLSWRGLGQALNQEWAMSLSLAEWRTILEPADQRTLRGLCEAISRQARIESLPDTGLLECRSLEGRAMRSLRAVLLRLGMPRNEIRTTTPVTPLLSKYGWRLLTPCVRLAPGALPAVRHAGRIHRALWVVWAALILASIPLVLYKLHLGAESLSAAMVVTLLLLIPHPVFQGKMVLPGIANLGDLAACLAKKRSEENGAAPSSRPPSPSAFGASKGGAWLLNNKFSKWLQQEIIFPHRRRAPSRWEMRMAKVFQCIVLLALCLFALWRVLLCREVSSQFARIRAAGYPVSGTELNAWRPPVPDAENGAVVLTQAFALLRTFPDARSNEVLNAPYLSRTNQWSAATRALVDAYVQTNAPALARAREALLLARFHYPVDFSYGPETTLPHLHELREIARLAALAAGLEADEGRADDWPDQVEIQLKIAATLEGEPDLESYLFRNSIIRMAVRTTERSLNRVSPSEGAVRRLQAAFTRAGATNSLPLALIGERAKMIPTFRWSWKEMEAMSQDDGPDSKPQAPHQYLGKPAFLLWLSGLLERDLNFYLQITDKSISMAAMPPPASLTLTNYLESADEVAHKKLYLLSSMWGMSSSRAVVSEASSQARLRLAMTALAVEAFRRERGRLPVELKELTPQFLDAVSTDPFDGAPLRYRLLPRGYIIYSVDADGHDDGGREPPDNMKSSDTNSYDLTFVVEH
jgi:hypothetical protein